MTKAFDSVFFVVMLFFHCESLSILPENGRQDRKSIPLGHGNRRAFQMSGSNVIRLGEMMSRKNVSLLIDLMQTPNTEGTLLAVYSRPGLRMVDIYVDGKEKMIRVSFRIQTGTLDEVSGEKDLTDGKWHKLILEVQGETLRLLVDCQQVLGGRFPEMDFSEMTASYARPNVWIGQLHRHISLFTGRVKEFSANSGSLSEKRCTGSAMTGASTLGPDLLKPDHAVSYLNHRVRYLENEFKRWREVVDKHERQLQAVHLHQRGCKLDHGNIFLSDGEKWTNVSSCRECQCHRGETHCSRKGCPKLSCSHPVLSPERDPCCPHCGKKCFYMGKYYEHGHIYWPKKCVRCSCTDGNPKCSYQKSQCPSLSCPRHQQKTHGNQCCPVCENQDFCATAPCHSNATCTNGPDESLCRCKDGFFGSGFQCFDIDECLWTMEMSQQLGGCGKGTRCINTPGSFRCVCLPGYMKIGSSNSCIDVVLV